MREKIFVKISVGRLRVDQDQKKYFFFCKQKQN